MSLLYCTVMRNYDDKTSPTITVMVYRITIKTNTTAKKPHYKLMDITALISHVHLKKIFGYIII